MLAEYSDAFPSVIVRFAALFSDWCEYPPLYMFLRTWLSRAWNRAHPGRQGASRPFPTCTSRTRSASSTRLLSRPETWTTARSSSPAPTAPSATASSTRGDAATATTTPSRPVTRPSLWSCRASWCMDLLGRFMTRDALRTALDGQLRGPEADHRRLAYPRAPGLAAARAPAGPVPHALPASRTSSTTASSGRGATATP